MPAGLLSTCLGGGGVPFALGPKLPSASLPLLQCPCHLRISFGMGCLLVVCLVLGALCDVVFLFEPIWEGRMKMGMVPDMTEESQFVALD